MCGRIEYVVHSKSELEGHYGVRFVEGHTERGVINARYNIPPTAITPVLAEEHPDAIVYGHWGYRPSWAKEPAEAKEVINARAETLFEKPYFKSSILTRRCLIPVTGFFEWKREGMKKTPYRFHMNGEIFSLGGIYIEVADMNGVVMPHYAIITTGPNAVMEEIHDRMPVIIDAVHEKSWIDESLDEYAIAEFCKPNPTELLQRYEISSRVNNPRNDTPEILTPVSN